MKRFLYISVLILLAGVLLAGCERETFVTDSGRVELTFSADTVAFDTVFTTVGTTTRQVRVYNSSGDNLKLSSVTLAGGRASRFRLNVDGDTSLKARDIEIAAGDSIFIFIQACIDPTDATAPFVIEDAIVFSNGQRLPLSAWGRNAVYHKAPEGSWVHVIDCDAWDHTRPHVLIDTVAVDSLCTLTLNAGDELYFANNALLIVWNGGTLKAQGTAGQPVLFTSLRHDGWYDFLPGQWMGIWFYQGSRNNVIDHAVIENGTMGLVVDSNVNANPTLAISNSIVRNMSGFGLWGRGTYLTGDNVLLYQCGTATLWAYFGGRYSFNRCTFANYWDYGSRQNAGVVVDNWYQTTGGAIVSRDLVAADFTDCIIWGSRTEGEVELSASDGAAFNYSFTHCLVRGGEWDEDPLFSDPSENDYTLREGSPATGIGYQF